MTLQEAATEFRTKLWRTAGARFHAWRRLKNRNTFSAFTISILSVYLIGIAVYQKIYELGAHDPELDNRLTFIAIVGAVFIIVLSLIEWAADFSVNAKRMFDSATEIKALQNRMNSALVQGIAPSVLAGEYAEVQRLYTALTDKNSVNHEPVDDLLFRAQNPSETSSAFRLSRGQRIWARVWWLSHAYGLYVVALVSPAFAIYGKMG